MFKINFKLALRNLFNRRYYTVINILGLTIGLASFILLNIFVWDELSYDKYHENSDRIFRVINVINYKGIGEESSGSPFPLGPTFEKDYPDIVENVVRIFNFQKDRHVLSIDSITFDETQFFFTDTSLFSVFDYEFISGSPEKSFRKKNSLIITESKAKEYFGNKDPIGESIVYEDRIEFKVTGVIKDPPTQSHFSPEFLATFSSLEAYYGPFLNKMDWIWNPCWTYLLLKKDVDYTSLDGTLKEFSEKYFFDSGADTNIVSLYLQPITDIHLHSHLDYEMESNSNYMNVVTISFISFFILIAAIINYINLTTANGIRRANEISVKKIFWAGKIQILSQFLYESIIMSFIALLLSLAIVEWIMPHYGVLTGKDFSDGISLTLKIIVVLLSIGLATGLLAGIYPALQLSRFNPVQILGDKINLSEYSALPRKILVTAQTALSISLVITSLGIYKHYKHIVTLNLGFDYKNVLVINVEHSPLTYYFEEFRDSLMKKDGVINVTGFNYVPGVEHNIHPYLPEGFGADAQQFYPAIQVKKGFFDTYNIKFKAGESYDQSDQRNGIIINEAMVHYLKWGNCEDAIGKRFDFGHKQNKRIVIGVTEDFNVTSLHDTIVPFVVDKVTNIPTSAFFTKFLAVRYEAGKYDEALKNIKELWNYYHDNIILEYRQHEDILLDLYESERILSSLIYIFTIIAIVIAILGMLGLSSFLTEQRTREIGVRKANGASSIDILRIILKEYFLLGILSVFIAWPIAYFLLDYITKEIAYRATVGIFIYLAASLLSILIIGVTVVIQSLNASNKNPADALRYE